MLKEAIRNSVFTDLTDAQAAAAMAEVIALPDDNTAYTWPGVNVKLGEQGVSAEVRAGWDAIVTTLPGGTMLDRMLSSGGVNFALPDVQGLLSQTLTGLQAIESPTAEQTLAISVVQALIKVGKPTAARWKALNLEALPTESEITAARTANELSDWWTARRALVDDAVVAGTVTTQQQLIDLLEGN
jgi:hypothetical protein